MADLSIIKIINTKVKIMVSLQRSASSYQLNERIQKDMIGDKVDHFSSESLNFLFLLKAEC